MSIGTVATRHILATESRDLGKLGKMSSTRALTKVELDLVRARITDITHDLELGQGGRVSQATVALEIGISQQTLSKFLAGGTVGLFVAKKVAKYLGITLGQLLSPRAPRELEQLLSRSTGRWRPPTIAAVRRAVSDGQVPNADELTGAAWEAMIDRIDVALGNIFRSTPPPRAAGTTQRWLPPKRAE